MMESSPDRASADCSAAEGQEPPRKRQKLASPSFTPPSEPLHESALSQKMASKVWSNGSAFQAQLDREARSGILCFVNPSNSGFTGILKQRYTDFLVNEVDLEGNVVHLTDINIPRHKGLNKSSNPGDASPLPLKSSVKTSGSAISEATDVSTLPVLKSDDVPNAPKVEANTTLPAAALDGKKTNAFILNDDDAALLDSYFGGLVRASIVKLYERIVKQPNAKTASYGSVTSEPITDRELRKKMHQDVRRIFDSRFETRSDANGVIQITAAVQNIKPKEKYGRTGYSEGREKLRGKLSWEELGGENLHFTLYKENKDTMEVMGFVSTRLKTKTKQFSFAGTKDRRAVTVQRVSAYRLHAEDLNKLNSILFGSKIGNFKYEKRPLELGDLLGNEFVITLRDCKFNGPETATEVEKIAYANNVVGAAVDSMKIHGFINYFGLQRFGTYEIGTDEVGKKILQGDFEGAINAILAYDEQALSSTVSEVADREGKSFPRDDVARAQAIKEFKTTGKSASALEKLPRRFAAETHIIRHLSKHPRDFIGALMLLQRNLRLMYVHAYQSLVWNLAASKRWARFGNNVVQGDLVLIDAKSLKKSKPIQNVEVDESGEIIVLPAADDVAFSHDDLFERARALTAEEAASGRYSIFDIVLSTPGYDIEYPQNEIGDFYKEFMMSESGGGIDPGNMRRSQKDFSLSGSYRKFMARTVGEIGYEVKLYGDVEEQLVDTDLDRINKSDPRSRAMCRPDASSRSGCVAHASQKPHVDKTANSTGNAEGLSGPIQPTSVGRTPAHFSSKKIQDRSSGHHAMTQGPAPLPGVNMELHNAWKALPTKIAQDERAEAAEYAAKKAAEAGLPKSAIAQPTYKDTFIQTSADGRGRTGRREVNLVRGIDSNTSNDNGPADALDNVIQPSNGQPSSEQHPAQFDGAGDSYLDEGLKPENSKAVEAQSTAESQKPAEQEKKIAVIIKFQLGSSQYATMALRELMKNGGVQYKPEFSKPLLAKAKDLPNSIIEPQSEALVDPSDSAPIVPSASEGA